jgi:threonyl-tRNA synthetase
MDRPAPPSRAARLAGLRTTAKAVGLDGRLIDLVPGVGLDAAMAPEDSAIGRLAAARAGAPVPRRPSSVPAQWGWLAAEEASGAGFVRLSPTGVLLARLIEDWLERLTRERLLGEEIRTPALFRWQEGAPVRTLAESFSSRLFHVTDDHHERLVLRYGADPGFFSLARQLRLSRRQLPLRLYELVESFRRSQRGELQGIRRLQSFKLVDHHALCADTDEALAEYRRLLGAQLEGLREWGGDWAVEFTVVDSQLERCRPLLEAAVQAMQRPALVQLLSKPKHYWGAKHVFYDGHLLGTFNTQLDEENAERFGLRYTDAKGAARLPTVLHTALGTIERWILLAAVRAVSTPGSPLPLWLTPVQVRLLPVGRPDLPTALELAERLRDARVRVDVDDRARSLGWRVRAAVAERVPSTIAVGEEEASTGQLPIRDRAGAIARRSVAELAHQVRASVGDMPFRQLGYELVSRRCTIA